MVLTTWAIQYVSTPFHTHEECILLYDEQNNPTSGVHLMITSGEDIFGKLQKYNTWQQWIVLWYPCEVVVESHVFIS